MQKAKYDVLNSIGLLLFSVLIYFGIDQIPLRGTAKTEGDFFPRIILGVIVFLSVLLLIKSVLIWLSERRKITRSSTESNGFKALLRNNKKVFVCFLIFFVYLLALPELGYFLSSILFLFVFTMVLAYPTKKYLVFAIGSIVITLILFVIFQQGLSVYLPSGRLF